LMFLEAADRYSLNGRQSRLDHGSKHNRGKNQPLHQMTTRKNTATGIRYEKAPRRESVQRIQARHSVQVTKTRRRKPSLVEGSAARRSRRRLRPANYTLTLVYAHLSVMATEAYSWSRTTVQHLCRSSFKMGGLPFSLHTSSLVWSFCIILISLNSLYILSLLKLPCN
jgi:hypothetical protein